MGLQGGDSFIADVVIGWDAGHAGSATVSYTGITASINGGIENYGIEG